VAAGEQVSSGRVVCRVPIVVQGKECGLLERASSSFGCREACCKRLWSEPWQLLQAVPTT
jgi:hypothetical protein